MGIRWTRVLAGGSVGKRGTPTRYDRLQVRIAAWVVPEPARCVQCGICSYYCPIDIDVRRHAWLSLPVEDSHCLTCGECVSRCPRGVLRFERTPLFEGD